MSFFAFHSTPTAGGSASCLGQVAVGAAVPGTMAGVLACWGVRWVVWP